MARENKKFVLAQPAKHDFIPGETFRLEKGPAPTADNLKDGQILVEALYLSLDPGARHWLNDSPSSLVQRGDTMFGFTVSRVIASKSGLAKEGDIVTASSGWAEVAIVEEPNFSKAEIPKGGRLTDLLGVLGVTGITAYIGLEKIGKPQTGETVVVSAAAGATGSVVGQIAKLRGCRVVGIAGSDEKCDWLKNELGFDAALNYKKDTFKKDLAEATPNQIDVFWDNVGGEILDEALLHAKQNARFVICGAITTYNNPKDAKGVYNLAAVIMKSIRMEGFSVFNFVQEWPGARKALGGWLAEGKLKRKDTIVQGGLEKAEYAFRDLFQGKNRGKLLVEIKPAGQDE
ncbi:hypothetical protein F5B22DRAFT_176444 [Xylaria bambusicola]|uniref:uncharacterized protein n=1 Tax=Xylaria bambusicola TaxID=326684 RepID=UPI002007B786|nr:uncharacterized protein F5B22DRAFT_176444 [Xylaria bambusicola]KAI0516707.1 hypothetical protein F5B22DRAFT_176444 [Xylaria bambusicola]